MNTHSIEPLYRVVELLASRSIDMGYSAFVSREKNMESAPRRKKISFTPFQRVFGCKNRRRYSQERNVQRWRDGLTDLDDDHGKFPY